MNISLASFRLLLLLLFCVETKKLKHTRRQKLLPIFQTSEQNYKPVGAQLTQKYRPEILVHTIPKKSFRLFSTLSPYRKFSTTIKRQMTLSDIKKMLSIAI